MFGDLVFQAIELETLDECLSAQTLSANLINHVVKCTQEKRTYIEQMLKEGQQRGFARKSNDSEMRRIRRELPGKLDHAAVAAFEVGHYPIEHLRVVSEGPNEHRNGSQIMGRIAEMLGLRGSSPSDDGRNQLVNLLSLN